MENFRQDYLRLALTFVIFTITTLLLFFLKRKFSHLFSLIWRKFCVIGIISEEDFQKDAIEMKKATEQIVKDWMWMSKLISQMKHDQTNFVNQLQVMYEVKCKELEHDVNAALGEIAKTNDQRFQEMRQINEKVEEGIQFIKNFLQTLVTRPANDLDEKVDNRIEMQKKNKFDEVSCCIKKNDGDEGLILTMKKCLTDLFEDAKLHLSVDREEENRELEIILTKLSEDREDIKKTILQAFAIAAEQAKTVHDQFGQLGEDALKYLAVLNDNSNRLLKSKLDETDDVLKSTLNAVSRQTHDFDGVKKVIENMDGQFDELFEKLAQIYQVNLEHSEIIALSLEKTSENWVQNVSKIEKIVKEICNDTKLILQAFQEMKTVAYNPQQRDIIKDAGKEKSEQDRSVHTTKIQDQQIISQKTENMVLVYSSWERMRSASCDVENGCRSMCKLIDGLEQKLISLNESIEKLDDFIRGLNLDTLAERVNTMEYNEEAAGDGHSQIITSEVRNKSLTHKIQSATAIQNAIKLTDIILRKVSGKNNSQANENFTQPLHNAVTLADEEKENLTEVHKEH